VSSFLVLWDVDYTLVNASGVGRELYQLAFASLYDRDLPAAAAEANMAGRTDRAIALDVLSMAAVPDPPGQVSRFEAELTRLAPGFAAMVAATAKALPGARAALAAVAAVTLHSPLAAAADGAGYPVRQSLLTGNVRALAEVKLAPLGLTAHLDLDVGAYGNEHAVRAELVHLARDRAAAAYGSDFSGTGTVLVGDTPLDIEAALATGARAVGVATGRFTAAELTEAGAHAVLAEMVGHLRFGVVLGFRVPGGALLGELLLRLQRIASPRAPMRMHIDELHARICGYSPNSVGSRPASASVRINRETDPGKLIPTPGMAAARVTQDLPDRGCAGVGRAAGTLCRDFTDQPNCFPRGKPVVWFPSLFALSWVAGAQTVHPSSSKLRHPRVSTSCESVHHLPIATRRGGSALAQ